MDLLRSCYETDMQFFDPPGPPIRVRWYFCAPTAKPFPHWHRFGSGNWASEKTGWEGPGEIAWRPRTWADGEPPGPSTAWIYSGLALTLANATANVPVNSGSNFLVNKNHHIIVWVWYRTTAGALGCANVTDLHGNLYARDMTVSHPDNPALQLDVWRAKTGALVHHNEVRVTLRGGGKVSFAALDVGGLEDAPPSAVKTFSGDGGAPSVPPFATKAGAQVVLGAYSAAQQTGLVTPPNGWTGQGFVSSNAADADGAAATKLLDKKDARLAAVWGAAPTGRWVSAALAWDAIPKYIMPGTDYCGALQRWQHGSNPDLTSVPPVDPYGVSTCCGPVWFFLSCPKLTMPLLRLRIVAVHDKSPITNTVPGVEVDMHRNIVGDFESGFWYYPNGTPFPAHTTLGMTCVGLNVRLSSLFSASPRVADNQRQYPWGLSWDYFFPFDLLPPIGAEWWEIFVYDPANPPPPPLLAPPFFPPGWFPPGWWPPGSLGF